MKFFKLQRHPTHTKRSCIVWTRPPKIVLKLNVNGTLFFDQQKTIIDMILRDHKETLCFLASIDVPSLHELEVIELLAILRGFQLCLMKGIKHLIVESAKGLSRECKGVANTLARHAWYINNIVIWESICDFVFTVFSLDCND